MLYKAIDQTRQFLRGNLRRDSLPWKAAVGVVKLCDSVHHLNPLNKRRWEANRRQFEQCIEAHERATEDFWFVQVGACDGLMDDPICQRIKQNGWRGVLVEPQRHEFERLRANYENESERLAFENVAIAPDNVERTLYKVKEDRIQAEWQRGIASFLPLKGIDDPTMITTETVHCMTFETLMARNQLTRIDLLQVDVEGFDYEILKLVDLSRIKPRLIQYEHRHLSLSDTSACRDYLERNGYRVMPMEYDTAAVLETTH